MGRGEEGERKGKKEDEHEQGKEGNKREWKEKMAGGGAREGSILVVRAQGIKIRQSH